MAEVDKARYSPQAMTSERCDYEGYWTGPNDILLYQVVDENATHGLIGCFDASGSVNQTLQGADLLSRSLNCLVLVPDFFGTGGMVGKSLPPNVLPPDTDEKMRIVDEWRRGPGDLDAANLKLRAVLQYTKTWHSFVECWGCYGLGWGGKLTVLNSAAGTPFKVAGAAYPERLAKEDVDNLAIPFTCLFSKEDGSPELEKEYREALEAKSKENVVMKFEDMPHGWMGGRADLQNEAILRDYEKG